MLVIAAPGQGAQTPGFLASWLELPGFADRLGAWSELAGCDLVRCGTTADADEIKDTAVAQPLLVAAAIATAADQVVTGAHPVSRQSVGVAGHSVGELAAGALAGVIAPDDAMRLVRVRATGMAAAAAAEQTGMTAVLGGDEATVLAAIEAHGLTPANVNAAGQIVAAGTMAQLEAFAANPPAGARLRPLSVAGAFHTHHMAPAVDALAAAAAEVHVEDPVRPLLSNRDGAVVKSGPEWLDRIINQVSAPVRWDLCMQTMASLGVTALIELPPAGTLTGLAKRGLPGIQLVALKTPDDLGAARALLAQHADSHDDHHAPDWRLLVAPAGGVFRAPDGHPGIAAPGSEVGPQTDLGRVEVRGGDQPLATTFPAMVIEWLVEDGDPVSAGQPLLRLLPKAAD
ncbi:MAG: acyltransferase domain-containing protein [Actinobacteria bacterium]|nr:acyltransferase domain-containing protein [Actinomycetota bacterium]